MAQESHIDNCIEKIQIFEFKSNMYYITIFVVS